LVWHCAQNSPSSLWFPFSNLMKTFVNDVNVML